MTITRTLQRGAALPAPARGRDPAARVFSHAVEAGEAPVSRLALKARIRERSLADRKMGVSAGRIEVDGQWVSVFHENGEPRDEWLEMQLRDQEAAAFFKSHAAHLAKCLNALPPLCRQVALRDGTMLRLAFLDGTPAAAHALSRFIDALPDLSAFRMNACGDRMPSARGPEALRQAAVRYFSQAALGPAPRRFVAAWSRDDEIAGLGGLEFHALSRGIEATGTKMGVAQAHRRKGLAVLIKSAQIGIAQAVGAGRMGSGMYQTRTGESEMAGVAGQAARALGLRYDGGYIDLRP